MFSPTSGEVGGVLRCSGACLGARVGGVLASGWSGSPPLGGLAHWHARPVRGVGVCTRAADQTLRAFAAFCYCTISARPPLPYAANAHCPNLLAAVRSPRRRRGEHLLFASQKKSAASLLLGSLGRLYSPPNLAHTLSDTVTLFLVTSKNHTLSDIVIEICHLKKSETFWYCHWKLLEIHIET